MKLSHLLFTSPSPKGSFSIEKMPYVTEVLLDKSDLPLVQNKDCEN